VVTHQLLVEHRMESSRVKDQRTTKVPHSHQDKSCMLGLLCDTAASRTNIVIILTLTYVKANIIINEHMQHTCTAQTSVRLSVRHMPLSCQSG